MTGGGPGPNAWLARARESVRAARARRDKLARPLCPEWRLAGRTPRLSEAEQILLLDELDRCLSDALDHLETMEEWIRRQT